MSAPRLYAHRARRYFAALGALVLTFTSPMSAQTNAPDASPPPRSARAAVEEFWSAVWARDVRRVAAVIDPEALAGFQRYELATLAGFAQMDARRKAREARGEAGAGTAIDAVSFDDIPAHLTEAQRQLPVRGITGVERLGELEQLTPAKFLERLLGGWASVRWAEGARPETPREPPAVVGEVAEGDSLAHVVYRSLYALEATVPGRRALPRDLAMPAVQVMTARRGAGGWYVVPDNSVFFWLAPPWMPTLDAPPGKH